MRSFSFGFWAGLAVSVVLAWLLRSNDQGWNVELPIEPHLHN